MENLKQLFMHELQDIYFAEIQIMKMLPEMKKEATDEKLQEAIEHHRSETKEQIERLNKVFELFGSSPKATECPGIEGLKKEHDMFLEESPSPDVLQVFDIGAASKVEHYEMCAYTSLIGLAKLLDKKEAADLLGENLREEREMAEQLSKLQNTIGKQAMERTTVGAAG